MAQPPRLSDDQAQPVESRQLVHRGIWQTAMEHAGGDPRRVRVISFTEVEVTTP